MNRRAVIKMTCLALGAAIVMMSVPGCSGTRHKDRFQWAQFVKNAIEYKAANKNEPVYFDVPRIMPFAWEELYVFPPYTSVESIEKALGFGWGLAKDIGLSERDDITLLVFVIRKGVHEYIEQPRSEGDFSRLKTGRPYEPNQAYFEVIEEDLNGQPWFYFVEAERPR